MSDQDQMLLVSAADEYARRCRHIGQDRQASDNLTDAIRHNGFVERHHELLDQLVLETKLCDCIRNEPPWKSIKTGTHEAGPQLTRDNVEHGRGVSERARTVLSLSTLASTEVLTHLVEVTPRRLGFTRKPMLEALYVTASRVGLGLCLTEVGAQLGWQYLDQAEREHLVIATVPIPVTNPNYGLFYLERRFGLLLDVEDASPDRLWDLDTIFVFTHPDSTSILVRAPHAGHDDGLLAFAGDSSQSPVATS